MGKNNKKFKWDELDYAKLTEDSLEAIDWTQVNFKKAVQSTSFAVANVDLVETSSSSAAFKSFMSAVSADDIQQYLYSCSSAQIDWLRSNTSIGMGAGFFVDQPTHLGELDLVAGSSGNDSLKVKGGKAYFGGDGRDVITGLRTKVNGLSAASILVGGDGDDVYNISSGAFAVISDFGNGYDSISLDSFGRTSTYLAEVEDDFLLVTDSKTIALIHDCENIEEVKFGGRKYSTDDLISLARHSGRYLGSTSFDSLVNVGYLAPSMFGLDLSSDGINDLLLAAKSNSEIVF